MPNQWIHADVEVGGLRFHYHRAGLGKPRCLVLTHGFTDDGLCWSPVAKALEGRYDVVMPDMRGHGRSARVRPGDRVDMAEDLAGIIRALGLREPILCGHSMGAMTTYQAVLRYPELARAVVLEDPPWWMEPWPADSPALTDNPFVAWARSLPDISLESLLEGYRKDHPTWPDDLIQAMCESKKSMDQGIIDIMAPKMNKAEGHWTRTIGSLACPLLVITGNPALGGIVSPEVADQITRLNPRARVVNVPSAGHLIRFDAFKDFMAALEAFLEGIA
jgi:pimeloyl-ACP methyl ester carboxylesterase